ncbi:MAG: PD-(D/E)XK nuclease family protein [Candidatus Binataceae bacterium]|nr:PD-(D/E)XK nuclease family protein [Candidatus Binataceae bacterium]
MLLENNSTRFQIVVSPRTSDRLAAANSWLATLAPGTESIVVAHVPEAADDLIRQMVAAGGALFGVHRMTFYRLAGLIAAETLAARELAPIEGLAAQAVAARMIHTLMASGALGYFEPVARRPGFPDALVSTLSELRLNRIDPAHFGDHSARDRAVAAMLAQYDAELEAAGLADRAAIVRIATECAVSSTAPRFANFPLLLLDVPLRTAADCGFIRALAGSAPQIFATAAQGDDRTIAMLEDALGVNTRIVSSDSGEAQDAETSLVRLQRNLFAETSPAYRDLDSSVEIFSAAGEMQECVEIARLIHTEAYGGVAFDRMAILLHAPERYTPYLREALDRAEIPAYFSRGTDLPEPGGRALMALLACAAEGLSARRFAEYLSLAQVPYPHTPSRDSEDARRFTAFTNELAPLALASDLEDTPPVVHTDPINRDPVPIIEGTLVAPWRWEQLLVEAAVVGGRDRWRRRINGLTGELELKRAEVADDDARAAAIDRQLRDLSHLNAYGLPIIDALALLPDRALWIDWLAHLEKLAAIAIRDADKLLKILLELAPMAQVGPVTLDEIRLVLARRIGEVHAAPVRKKYGAVFVGPVNNARGIEFEIVFTPGLTERMFPRKLNEDPIMPDAARAALKLSANTDPQFLENQTQRAAHERLALRLAAGSASRRAIFSFPRFDLAQGRPRVPSFYALEIMRAAEGRLPGFDELSRRAAADRSPRLGWPAPANPNDAIDVAEFDLAALEGLLDQDADKTRGAARYLLADANLARVLRSRARRWWPKKWTPADGLVDPSPGAREALQKHQFKARSYSPTALQNFSACPYKFFLQAIHRLQPRDEIEAIEIIDPLTRGGLFHEIQFRFLSALRAASLLPVTLGNHDAARALLQSTIEQAAGEYRDRLAPAIDRVWRDGIDSIGADLREWLRRLAESRDSWIPDRFELAFGLPDRANSDPASRADSLALAGGLKLRGSIDLVERRDDGALRVTDHKTGRVRADRDVMVGGGKVLQPLLYALAAENLLGAPVAAGRLYYCTAAGAYEERVTPLTDEARTAINEVTGIIGRALADGFLPAAPAKDECRYCDYRPVCGPYEEQRVARKPAARLGELKRMRQMR